MDQTPKFILFPLPIVPPPHPHFPADLPVSMHTCCTCACLRVACMCVCAMVCVHYALKLQALVYNILPSTSALFSYALGSRKLSANEQFFCWCSNSISLLQTIQIISDVCFITDHVAYASSNKTKIVWIETDHFFYPGWMRLMFTCVLGR